MEQENLMLLSSMSPKLNKIKPNKVKIPSKLALKTNIRRSFICDKYQRTVPEKNIEAVDIISSSSSSTNSKKSNNCDIIVPILSSQKTESIKNWLNDLPDVNNSNDIDLICDSFLDNVSCIDGALKSKNEGKIFNSTKLENFNKDFKPFLKPEFPKIEDTKAKTKINNLEVIDLISSDTSESDEDVDNHLSYNCTIVEESFEDNKENLDDNFEKNEEILKKSIESNNKSSKTGFKKDELFLSKTEPKDKIEIKPSKDKSQRETIVYKNPYLELNDPKSALKKVQINQLKKKFDSPWKERLKNICDSDTDPNESPLHKNVGANKESVFNSPDFANGVNNKIDSKVAESLFKTPCNKEDLDLLYELYGDSLSQIENLNLPKTEPKKETKRDNFKHPNTEKHFGKRQALTESDLNLKKITETKNGRRKLLLPVALTYGNDEDNLIDSDKNNIKQDSNMKKMDPKITEQRKRISEKFNEFRSKYDDNFDRRAKNNVSSSDSEIDSPVKPKKIPVRNKTSTRKNGKVSSTSWESGSDSSDEFRCNKPPIENLLSAIIQKKKLNDDKTTSPYFMKDKKLAKTTTSSTKKPIEKNLPQTFTFLQSLSKNVPIEQCDTTVRLFRKNFKQHRDKLYEKLFKLFNDKIFNNCMASDTLYEWSDRMTATGGYCCCKKITRSSGAIERSVRFVLSSKVIDSADRLRDTLVHEMCHAATWLVNQVADGHGPYWKSWASKAMNTFPELPPIKRCHDYNINTKYTYKCNDCGYSFGRHTKSLNLERKRCGYCYGTFNVLINKQKKNGDVQSVPITPKKEPTGFALFVKENYAKHKLPSRKHADVMKVLSEKFALTKID